MTAVVQWYAEHRALLCGVAVAGFGAGALVAGPLADDPMSLGAFATPVISGVLYAVLGTLAASLLPLAVSVAQSASGPTRPCSQAAPYGPREALKTQHWYAIWLVLLLNVSAGSALLSQAAPMAQEVCNGIVVTEYCLDLTVETRCLG